MTETNGRFLFIGERVICCQSKDRPIHSCRLSLRESTTEPTKDAGTLRRAVRSQAFARILGGRHMECAYYFGGRHMECAYYFDFCRLCQARFVMHALLPSKRRPCFTRPQVIADARSRDAAVALSFSPKTLRPLAPLLSSTRQVVRWRPRCPDHSFLLVCRTTRRGTVQAMKV